LFASGRTTGVVVDIGDTLSIVPLYEGYEINQAISRINLGGKDCSLHLSHLLKRLLILLILVDLVG